MKFIEVVEADIIYVEIMSGEGEKIGEILATHKSVGKTHTSYWVASGYETTIKNKYITIWEEQK